MCLLSGKDNLCCLARGHMRHGCGEVEEEDTRASLISLNLESNK